MNLKYIFTMLAIFIAAALYSQNKPWKTQGNNVNNSAFIGTTNNKALKLKTNNQLRLLINKLTIPIPWNTSRLIQKK